MKATDALRELANTLDDLGLPSMSIDNIRREVSALVARHLVSNDNNQPGDST